MLKKVSISMFFLTTIFMTKISWAGCDIDGYATRVETDTIGNFRSSIKNTKARIQVDLDCADAPDPVRYELTAAFVFRDEWLTLRVGSGWRAKGNNIRQWFHQIPSLKHLAGHNEYRVCLWYTSAAGKLRRADCDTIDLGLE